MTEPTEPAGDGARRRLSQSQMVALAGAAAVLLIVLIVVAVTRDGGSSGKGNSKRAAASDSGQVVAGGDTAVSSDSPDTSAASGPTTTSTTSTATTTVPTEPNSPTTAPPAGTNPPPAPPTTSPRTDSPNTTSPNQDPDAPRPPVGPQGPLQSTACAYTGPPTVPSAVNDVPSPAGQWQTIASAQGNCGGGSGSFTLTGAYARVVFRSDADQMLVFLVNVNQPDDNAGYADVDCRARCADEGILTLSAGTYQIQVQATDGPWEVEVQEFH